MTIGEKIRYCRKQIGITQDRLAELTGIHPVSIRKYETNKAQPQIPQLEKLAVALNVSYNALNDNDTAGFRLKTVGDLMGILIVLCNSGILQITGKRGEDDLLIDETVSIQFNPHFSSYLEFNYTTSGITHSPALPDVLLKIKCPTVFQDLLKWEKMDYLYRKTLNSMVENPNNFTQTAIDEIKETKEKMELELQANHMPIQ